VAGISLGPVLVKYTQFPARAGDLQSHPQPRSDTPQAGVGDGLIAELGDNYDRYHGFLVELWTKLRRSPSPDDFRGDLPGYMRACDLRADVLRAEQLLRCCWAIRQQGAARNAAPDPSTPLLDDSHRLLSVESGLPAPDDPGDAQAADWQPTGVPDWAAISARQSAIR
jgi:hypothetical protein